MLISFEGIRLGVCGSFGRLEKLYMRRLWVVVVFVMLEQSITPSFGRVVFERIGLRRDKWKEA